MTNGSRFSKVSVLVTGLSLVVIIAFLVAGYRWATQPRTPEDLFRVRCAACHELRVERVCAFEPALRPAIVDTMRRLHEADRVIDEGEAVVIRRYLEESLTCP
jgi:hypothetical protein